MFDGRVILPADAFDRIPDRRDAVEARGDDRNFREGHFEGEGRLHALTRQTEAGIGRSAYWGQGQQITTAATPFQEGNTGADPFVVQTTEFTEQFVKRYLAAVDIGSYSSGTSHYQSAILIMNAQNNQNGTSA
jgi:hypothetical protein